MKISSVLVAGLALAMSVTAHADKIKAGDPAPPLKVAKWIKGKPVKSFEKGKVYVVEFWATWCGPCRETIPHLTEMAKKFDGRATFTGVSVWESEPGTKESEYLPKVEKFVKEMGSKMDYNVAVDGADGTMAKTWMEAASQNGIPTAFIVDQNGKIAWIGHPMDGMESVIESVIVGSFDSKAWADQKAEQEASMAKIESAMNEVMKLNKEGKHKEALEKLDKVIAENPSIENALANFRYTVLLAHDEPAAFAYAKKLSQTTFKDNAMMLNQLAWSIVDDAAKLKSPDFDLAIELATRVCELSKWSDAYVLDTLAYAYFKKGNVDKAIEIQEKAVKALDSMKEVDEATQKEIRDRLVMFKKKKADG